MNTLSIVFIASTVVAGFAFGLAMLWVTAEWLKSEAETEECEASAQATLRERNVRLLPASPATPG